jgi:hypothetical protein
LATSTAWGRNTAVFIGGAAISISLFVTYQDVLEAKGVVAGEH